MIPFFFLPFSFFSQRVCFFDFDLFFLAIDLRLSLFPSTVRISLMSVLLWGLIAARSAAKSGLFRFLVDLSRLLTSSVRIPVSLSCWNNFGDPNRRQYKIASVSFLSLVSISNSLSISRGLFLLLCLDMALLTTLCQIIIFFDYRNPFFQKNLNFQGVNRFWIKG